MWRFCPVPALLAAVRAPEALNVLAVHLQGHGLTRLYGATEGRLGVLSVAEGVTVWTDGKVLCWHINGEETRLPAADPAYAAWTLTRMMGGERA